ncbi:hypothetical protein [Brevundimonas naejangsanensis]|uniref:hypothetical protein n=1 Tax=Brevundimonas naejangsanensis TaxID=588932 RepID=UPI003CFF2572
MERSEPGSSPEERFKADLEELAALMEERITPTPRDRALISGLIAGMTHVGRPPR